MTKLRPRDFRAEIDAFVPLSEEHQRQQARFAKDKDPAIFTDAEQRAIHGWVLFKRWLHKEEERRKAAALASPAASDDGDLLQSRRS